MSAWVEVPLWSVLPLPTLQHLALRKATFSPFWLGWSKNTCSPAGAEPHTQVQAVWSHRVIPPPLDWVFVF